jgi:FAD-linked oxidoreductase
MAAAWRNWSGWVASNPDTHHAPESETELTELLPKAAGPIRVMGAGHSFTPLGAEARTLITLENLAGLIDTDTTSRRATVRAGTPLYALGPALFEQGLALINQGDIDRQALAGAVSTGTHGTGVGLGNFSSMVTGLRIATADGALIDADYESEPDVFHAGRLSLGALGVVTRLTMQCREAYRLKERVWLMAANDCFDRLETLTSATRHFEFFWFPYADDVIAKSLEETEQEARPPRPARKRPAEGDVMDAQDRLVRLLFETGRRLPMLTPSITRWLTVQAGRDAASAERKRRPRVRWSFEAFPSVRAIRFNEMEYALPAERGVDALREIVAMIRRKRINTVFPIEFRTIAADDVWLSPFQGRDSVTIAVHQYHKQSYERFFRDCEAIFRAHDGRPHWGKLHFLGARDLADLYPHWDDFQRVRHRLDPNGRFLNSHLRRIFEG